MSHLKQDRLQRAEDRRISTGGTPNTPDTPPEDQPPMPAPTWAPNVPVTEPEPDVLPDEVPRPNPDETRDPPVVEPSASAFFRG